MKLKQVLILSYLFLLPTLCFSQYVFSGTIEEDKWNGEAYLSIIEDYRKISGIHSEQIISKTAIEGVFFEFKGDNLEFKNRIYRIHVDACQDEDQDSNHFEGYCDNSQEILFIANNKDSINLPISGDNQMFCDIQSSNKNSNVFFKIDSLKELMSYDYASYRSIANRKLNNKKWFSTFQQFGESLNEPLAELYIYQFLSNRSSELYSYYIEDVQSNAYYDELFMRLENLYPNTEYTEQYELDLVADKYIKSSSSEFFISWKFILSLFLGCSFLLNLFLINQLRKFKKRRNNNLTVQLTKQEQKVLDLILQDKTNKEIASEIFVSVSTVKTHINNLYKKLNLQSRSQVKQLFNS